MKILNLKFGRRPLGIWIAWAALVYSIALEAKRTLSFAGVFVDRDWQITLAEIIVIWPIIVVAVLSLILRRAIARTFVGIVLAFMLCEAISHVLPIGILLAIFGFWGLVANRRWFDERLPRIG